jgi:hypothetical protein
MFLKINAETSWNKNQNYLPLRKTLKQKQVLKTPCKTVEITFREQIWKVYFKRVSSMESTETNTQRN